MFTFAVQRLKLMIAVFLPFSPTLNVTTADILVVLIFYIV